MKLGEIMYDADTVLYEVIDEIFDAAVRHEHKPVRVEVHSIDDEWISYPPDGWGPGWPFRIGDTLMIVADDGRDQHEWEILAFVPSTGRIQRVNILDIDAFGKKG